jgi:hypothetical protein
MELVILGKGPTWPLGVDVAKRQGCELWTLNNAWQRPGVRELATAVFEMHKWSLDEHYKAYLAYNPVHTLSCPVYMQERFADVPTAVRYPIEEMTRLFGVSYFNNTICYMLALAIARERYRTIHLFGVDYRQEHREEREYERPCTEFWIGQGMARGINFSLPSATSIFTFAEGVRCLYGYDRRLKDGVSPMANG